MKHTCFVWVKKLAYCILFLFAIFFVEILLKHGHVPTYLFPLPSQIFRVYLEDGGVLLENLKVTAFEWSLGMFFSLIFGFLISALSFFSSFARRFFNPLLVVSQSVPYLIFAPLLMIWLGLGMAPKVVLVILTCTFPIALVLQNDLITAQKEYELVVQMLHLRRLQAFFHVYCPYALPGFFNALKISASYSFVAAVLAELIGSESGLGIYVLRSQSAYHTDKVMAAVILIVVMSILFAKVVDFLKMRVVFWNKARK